MKEREKWFTIDPIFKPVNKEDFIEFIEKYPRKLKMDVYGVCDPPLITYNDFELANRWPYGIVAKTYAYDDNPDGYYYEAPEKRLYCILANYKKLFDSRTGYKEN